MTAHESIVVFHLPAGIDARGAGWYWRFDLPIDVPATGPYETRDAALEEAEECAFAYDEEPG